AIAISSRRMRHVHPCATISASTNAEQRTDDEIVGRIRGRTRLCRTDSRAAMRSAGVRCVPAFAIALASAIRSALSTLPSRYGSKGSQERGLNETFFMTAGTWLLRRSKCLRIGETASRRQQPPIELRLRG